MTSYSVTLPNSTKYQMETLQQWACMQPIKNAQTPAQFMPRRDMNEQQQQQHTKNTHTHSLGHTSIAGPVYCIARVECVMSSACFGHC